MEEREECDFSGIEKCCRVSMSAGPDPSFDEEAEKIKDLQIDYVKIISEKLILYFSQSLGKCKISWMNKMTFHRLKAHSITKVKWNNSIIKN